VKIYVGFFLARQGLLIKKSAGFALILLVDLIHGNFLIGSKIHLHLLFFERRITQTLLTSGIFLGRHDFRI